MKFDEFVVKTKRDLEKISDKTKVVKINCDINMEDAQKLASKCRLLEEVVFERNVFVKTPMEVREYIDKWFYVDID